MRKLVLFYLAVIMTSILAFTFLFSSLVAASEDKPIVLRVSTFFPPTHLVTKKIIEPFCKEVETKSGGKLKAELYTGGTLGKAQDHADMILKGIIDVTLIVQGYTPGRFPLSSITELPFAFSSGYDQSEATWKLYKTHLYTEYLKYKVLGLGNTSRYIIGTIRKPVRTLEDLKGLKSRTPGGYVTKVFEALGVTPISMPSPEIFNSLERGIIDGYGLPYGPVTSLKLEDITKYITELDLGTLLEAVIMNKEKYESLPTPLKKVIDEAGDNARKNIPAAYEEEAKVAREKIIKKGIEVIEPSPKEVNRIEKIGMKVWKDWLKDMEGKGLPARETMKAYLELIPKVKREVAHSAIQ